MRIGARLAADPRCDVALDITGRVDDKAAYDKLARKRKRKSCPRTPRMRRRASPSPPPSLSFPNALQELFVACLEIFKGPGTVPTPHDVLPLHRILDDMKPEDVGLSSDLPFFDPESTISEAAPRVSYTTIHKCRNFSLCILFLPSGGVIPLHNHPGMTVLSKLLLGSVHVRSYDWIVPCDLSNLCLIPGSSNARPARAKMNGQITAPCKSSVLYPTTGGNIHEFKAVTPCAILDVIGPPYSQQDGRDCSYYRVVPSPEFLADGRLDVEDKDGHAAEGYGWLEEIEVAEEHLMDWIEYLGPQVMGMGC
ncbi:hypothetical protein MLD38_004544 [Melastoma candidum]|uniref:Uncharacterized protein n=1 Tax=Melastoma candidum TaxID=119954 RepID=A0ACB9S7C5_9MYRT|nr:hypothetical protein MLD38_004544 [Melastoma candidum]